MGSSGFLRRHRVVVYLASCAVWGCLHGQGVAEPDSAAARAHAWARDDYQPPAFEVYFPDSPEGAQRLAAWWAELDLDRAGTRRDLEVVRQGLRRYGPSPMPILRWVGTTFIWGEDPQDPEAIELMYHAATCEGGRLDPYGTRGPAIYFGLSVVEPKSPNILRTLVDIAMRVDDPNDLGRIAWGLRQQRGAALRYLAPYEASDQPGVREKAEAVRKIFNREIQAFNWARARRAERARQLYADQLNYIVGALRGGEGALRLDTLAMIEEQGIIEIVDGDFMDELRWCITDDDPKVRAAVARIVGTRWIWQARKPDPRAVDLMMVLAEDPNRDVRYNAVYFGLSTLRNKPNTVIRRLLEIAFDNREPNMYDRIVWGFRGEHEAVASVLQPYVDDPFWQEKARAVYTDMTGVEK